MTSLRTYPFRIFYSPADNPLENFYIPALSASVQYDRSAGFFSSSALAVAAKGVAHLIQNGGRMRLLVGAELSEADVEAIRQGYDLREQLTPTLLAQFPDPEDMLMKARLQALAWMVAEGTLEIKVALPKDAQGLPIPGPKASDYYHPKTGIFTDAGGDQVAFSGSVNESETGWQKNYETFNVFFSWDGTRPYLRQHVINFERLWNGEEPEWMAVDFPQAVQERLLKYRPFEAPQRDPLEPKPVEKKIQDPRKPYVAGSPQAERILFQFLRDAPYLAEAGELGAATAAFTPRPHQSRVVRRLVEGFPARAMLCDEVGLGKTIEAGLVMRQLLISGWVKRCLILAPKSVLKQWQEELYEKFGLEVPRYEGGKYLDLNDRALETELPYGGNPWEAYPVLLAGSQLAKRNDRRAQLLAAQGWDLLVVDEAHHARRNAVKEHMYRPNPLLGLLNDLKARHKVGGLVLMTATPMQVHPVEVWDLLSVLGMGGRWGADEENFLDFFSELRKPFGQIEWEFVYDMVRDYLATGGQIDADFRQQAEAELGPVQWDLLACLPDKPGQRGALIKQLGPKAEAHIKELARRHTPLNQLISRNTRALLREYKRRGILKDQVSQRKPRIERVPMRADEQALYNRIDEYIAQFYHKYENERRGLGFVMTVYRRRLTSSFYAVRCSLERRLSYLKGQLGAEQLIDDDDLEQEELEQDISEGAAAAGLDPAQRELFQAERAYVKDFIQQLRLLAVNDSKLEVLKDELNKVFHQRSTVLIFTQYADTMDYLREQLREVYGSQVACYSGRGGETWNGIAWVPSGKEAVKSDFREGKVRILIGTESASEGLNLQTCGVLINYDMPWNPMRVEQRIGRIDRIGQEYPEIWISNYFYRDTIEDQIYQRLADRIEWFEVVVGDLQPILAEIGETTRRLAMLPPNQRETQLEKAIDELRKRLQNREVEALNLDEFLETEAYPPGPGSPVTLEQIEYLLTQAQASARWFEPNPDLPGVYWLTWKGEKLAVTFSPKIFDEHPDTVRFLTYGSRLFDELLAAVPMPGGEDGGGLARCQSQGKLDLRTWLVCDPASGEARAVSSLMGLKDWLEKQAGGEKATLDPEQAQALHQAAYQGLVERHQRVVRMRREAEYQTLRVKAQQLLLRAALTEIAIGRKPDLFETDAYPISFSEAAIRGLKRHKFPWAPLVMMAVEAGMRPEEEDPFYVQIAHDTREALKGRFGQLTQEARRVVEKLGEAKKAMEAGDEKDQGEHVVQGLRT